MSNDITLSELQEFIGEFWFHYDEAHYDELTAAHTEDVRYLTRSDSGASPFEELMSPELRGRDSVMSWLKEHREASPYPLRHHTSNIHRTGADGDVTRVRFYIFVNQIANYVPFAVSSGVVEAGVRRGPNGLQFNDFEAILDTTNSELLSERHADAPAQ